MSKRPERLLALVLALLCLTLQQPAARAAETEEPLKFDCGIELFDARFKEMFDAMHSSYVMAEEPNIPGAYEYHLPENVYAKVLLANEQIECLIVMLKTENSDGQMLLWQYAAIMAAAVGDIPANTWLVLYIKATELTIRADAEDSCCFVAGNVRMTCAHDADGEVLYVTIEREENTGGEEHLGMIVAASVREGL